MQFMSESCYSPTLGLLIEIILDKQCTLKYLYYKYIHDHLCML